MTTETIDPREILLDGSVNFRDLGGLATANGEIVRRGLVFRSDALHALTAVDLDTLAGLHIATLIDLRSEMEISRSGPSPLVAQGTTVLHCPIMSSETSTQDADLSQPMEIMYARFLKGGADAFDRIFDSLAADEHLPTVIHCAAGKDRTGITIALLLRVLGVPDDVIVLDYAITDRNMVRLIDRLTQTTIDGKEVSYPAHVMRAAPATMEAFLTSLDEVYGSAESYLESVGVTANQLNTIRRRLLLTPA